MNSAQQSLLKNRFEKIFTARRSATVVELHEVQIDGRSVFVPEVDVLSYPHESSFIDEFVDLVEEAVKRQDTPGIQSLSQALLAVFPGSSSPGGFYKLACQSNRRAELIDTLQVATQVFAQQSKVLEIINQAIIDLSLD